MYHLKNGKIDQNIKQNFDENYNTDNTECQKWRKLQELVNQIK
jgi:hypothetical protein